MATLIAIAVVVILLLAIWLIVDHLVPFLWHLSNVLSRAIVRRLLRGRLEQWHKAGRTRIEPWLVYLPVALIVVAGLAISILAGDAFLDLAELLRAESPELRRADEAVHRAARDYRLAGLTGVFTAATIIGTPVGLGILVIIVSTIFVIQKHWRWSVYLTLPAVGGGLLNLALKDYFERQRPELSEALRSAHGYSFPSGHAMGAAVVFGAFTYLAWRQPWSQRKRTFAIAVAITMIVIIAASRIYLGVHWISDIAAGISAGALWTTATTTAYETFRRLRRVRERAEPDQAA